MAFLSNSAPIDWGRVLSAAGQGFMQAGTPGGNFGQGLMQGAQFYDQTQDRRQGRELEELRLDLLRQEQEANRLANTKAAQEDAALQALLNGGVQTASAQPVRQIGNYGASVGGAAPAQSSQPFFDPETAARLQRLPPSLQRAAVEAQLSNMFAAPKGPESSLGKLAADLRAGRISQPEYDAAVAKETYIKPQAPGGSIELDINGDGVADFTMGSGAGITKEWQSKDNNFANRLDNAIVGMDSAEASGYDPTATTAGGVADYVGQRSIGGLIGNALTSDKGKLWYRNAKEALAVILRKDTGAAVTPQEFELYGPLYLPMPWDDAATKASKKQAMLVMRNSLRQGIGQTPVAGQPAPAPSGPETDPNDPLGMRKK